MGGSSKPPAGSSGFRYFFGIHMLLGRGPLDELREIRVGDKLAWQGSVTANGPGEIFAPNLFGGDKKEGGIVGDFDMFMGESDQVLTGGVVSHQAPGFVTGFRRMATFFYDGQVCSVNPYPKPWSFRVRRAVKGWDGAVFLPAYAQIILGGAASVPDELPDFANDEVIGGNRNSFWAVASRLLRYNSNYQPTFVPDLQIKAMNPAHIIYEAHTNREWGRGLDRAMMDDESFTAAAIALHAEGFGLCMKWSRRDGLKSFVRSVLDTIAAALYPDPATGKIKIKLIRNDYVAAELPLYTTLDGILEFRESTTQTTATAVNEVVVEYKDPVLNEKKTVRAQNLASLQSTGGAFNSLAKSYLSVPTAGLAYRIAQRDLRANAEGIRRFEIVMNRKAWKLVPGSVFRLKDEARKVPEMVVRVVTMKNGSLTDGRITLTVVQDIFGFPAQSFVSEQPPGYGRPTFDPCIGRHKVFEVPYFMLARQMGTAVSSLSDAAAYVGAVAETGQSINTKYDMAIKIGATAPDEWPTNSNSYCGYTPP